MSTLGAVQASKMTFAYTKLTETIDSLDDVGRVNE